MCEFWPRFVLANPHALGFSLAVWERWPDDDQAWNMLHSRVTQDELPALLFRDPSSWVYACEVAP